MTNNPKIQRILQSQRLRNNTQNKEKATWGKFDRPSLREEGGSSDSEDDEMINYNLLEEEAENPAQSICDEIMKKPPRQFTTVEQEEGIKVASQQWRMDKKNVIMKRPKGLPYLLPVENEMKFPAIPKKYWQNGGMIHKPQQRKQITVQKGNLIYRRMLDDDNQDVMGPVIGIQTKKKPQEVQQVVPNEPASINIMLARFFGDLSNKLQNNPISSVPLFQGQPAQGPTFVQTQEPTIVQAQEPAFQMKQTRIIDASVSSFLFIGSQIEIFKKSEISRLTTSRLPRLEEWIFADT